MQEEEGVSRKPPELTKKTAEDSYFRYLSQVAYMTSSAVGSMVDIISSPASQGDSSEPAPQAASQSASMAEAMQPVVVYGAKDATPEAFSKAIVTAQPIVEGGIDVSRLIPSSYKEETPPPRDTPSLSDKMPSLPDALGRGDADRRRQGPETLPPQPVARMEQDNFEFVEIAQPPNIGELKVDMPSPVDRASTSPLGQFNAEPPRQDDRPASDRAPEKPVKHFWDLMPDVKVNPAINFVQKEAGTEEQALQGVSEASLFALTAGQSRYMSQLNSLLFQMVDTLREHSDRIRDLEAMMDRRYTRGSVMR